MGSACCSTEPTAAAVVVSGVPNDDRASDVAVEAQQVVEIVEESFDNKLATVLKLQFTFDAVEDLTTVNLDTLAMNFEQGSNWERNAEAIAHVLKESPETCIRIVGFAGPTQAILTSTDIEKSAYLWLSLLQTRRLRQVLQEAGCINKIAVKGMGHYDSSGSRCDLGSCTADEVDELEAEATTLEQEAKRSAAEAAKIATITFLTEDGSQQNIQFTKSPFGLIFKTGVLPVVINKCPPETYTASMGVKVGMKVVKVDGVDVSEMSFSQIHEALRTASAKVKV